MHQQDTGENLHRGLKERHIQLIALGGAIGTGLFLGSASTIQSAGPSALLGYAIAGLFAFFIMRQLGEMVVDEPVAGSFSYFADKYCGRFWGYFSGWNYWVLYILVGMAELSAVGQYIQFWFPSMPLWVSALICYVLINLLNIVSVKSYGEAEFWFAGIKVVAVVAMILFGVWLLASGHAGPQASVTNLWRDGFFPHGAGVYGLLAVIAPIMFSFGGLELVGITAAEASDPGRTIPKATNRVIYRILIFYIGSLAVLLSLYPWQSLVHLFSLPGTEGSPFVLIFRALNHGFVAQVLNVVVLSAALSVYNSCVYTNSRMLYGLAQQGNAPKFVTQVNRRGVPMTALAISALVTGLCVLINYLMKSAAFGFLMGLVVSALILNWILIAGIHLVFRRVKARESKPTAFPSFGYPVTNILTLLFLAFLLVVMWRDHGMRLSVELIPAWFIVMLLAYLIGKALQKPAQTTGSISQ